MNSNRTKLAKGELALVLHAHLPYVRSNEPGSLEEDWYFQALMECYLPLLRMLEEAYSRHQNPKITIGLSPTLVTLFRDEDLKSRFPKWIRNRLALLKDELEKDFLGASSNSSIAARHLELKIKKQLSDWSLCNGDLISRFKKLQISGVVDLLTCAATHGYLPLLRENPEAIKCQLETAFKEHLRCFKNKPLGIWLPECAYYEGLDFYLREAGFRYAILDGHGLLHAKPRPRYGLYAPICTKNGVAFFGRDSESTLPVWSAKEGYPGNSSYREFHRDLGWDLPLETIKKIGINEARPLGLKLHKVTGRNTPLNKKAFYEPNIAAKQTKEHANQYLFSRGVQLNRLRLSMGHKPLLVAPFDAELFGHWWFEGPDFLSELYKQAENMEIKFTHLRDVLNQNPKLQLCDPSPSSWGQGGYHNYWLNENNDWVVIQWNKASKSMTKILENEISDQNQIRIIKQALRELLLSQSSDWSFILRAGTTTDLAKNRINRHLNRFWFLISVIENKKELTISDLERIENEDFIFPEISLADWSN